MISASAPQRYWQLIHELAEKLDKKVEAYLRSKNEDPKGGGQVDALEVSIASLVRQGEEGGLRLRQSDYANTSCGVRVALIDSKVDAHILVNRDIESTQTLRQKFKDVIAQRWDAGYVDLQKHLEETLKRHMNMTDAAFEEFVKERG